MSLSTSIRVDRDAVARALSWVTTRGVETRSWPPPAPVVDAEPPDHPVLHLVDADASPPRCSELEDWLRVPIDLDELHARADRLLARSVEVGATYTRVDDDDMLRVGGQLVILSQLEARLMRTLIDHLGELVLREDLVEAIWPSGPPADPRALDNRVKCLRQRLDTVPLHIHTVRGRGLLLERTGSGFEHASGGTWP